MKRRAALTAWVSFALSACTGGNLGGLVGSGTKASVTRTPPTFSAIVLKCSADVTIKVGGAPSVTIETDDNLLANITTNVSGTTLTVSSDKAYSTHLGVRISVTAPTLDAIDAQGSGSIDATGIDDKTFLLHLAGSGDATVRGTTEHLTVSLGGSGNVRAFDLKAKAADVDLAGSGTVEVTASERVKATLAGSGNIDYRGNPAQIDKSVRGSGVIRAR